MQMYVPAREAIEYYNVSAQTLRTWADSGKIKYQITQGGHRRYFIEKIETHGSKRKFIYCRVSSKKQEHELQHQIEHLQKRYPEYELITDIGSGISTKREGFRTILECLFAKNLEEVVVTTADRFSRFGFELFEWLFPKFEGKITTEVPRTDDLSADILEIITVFAARYHGRRRYKNEEDSVLSDEESEADIA